MHVVKKVAKYLISSKRLLQENGTLPVSDKSWTSCRQSVFISRFIKPLPRVCIAVRHAIISAWNGDLACSVLPCCKMILPRWLKQHYACCRFPRCWVKRLTITIVTPDSTFTWSDVVHRLHSSLVTVDCRFIIWNNCQVHKLGLSDNQHRLHFYIFPNHLVRCRPNVPQNDYRPVFSKLLI